MKKNLLSVIILALLIVNIVLTSIMMFSVTGASKKTSALVNDIASVLSLELENNSTAAEGTETVEIPMENVEVFDISGELTIPCKQGEDGSDHYCITNVSLSLNTKDKGYKKYGGEELTARESLIKSEIFEVFRDHTIDEVREDIDSIGAEILNRIQTMFDSEFIFKVSFSNTLYQ